MLHDDIFSAKHAIIYIQYIPKHLPVVLVLNHLFFFTNPPWFKKQIVKKSDMPLPTTPPPQVFFSAGGGSLISSASASGLESNQLWPSFKASKICSCLAQIWRFSRKEDKMLRKEFLFQVRVEYAYRFRRGSLELSQSHLDVPVPSLLLRVHLFTQTLVVAGALCGRTHGMDVTIKGILRIHPAAVTPLLAHSCQANWEDTTTNLMACHPDESHSFFWVGTNPGPWTVKTAIQRMNAVLYKTPLPGCQLSLIFI